VTYVRVTRDPRGYENTFLLHSARPGERPRVLYWYRTAPGIRVGRIALDEDAIRGIEEQHPDIEFDWPQLLDEASTVAPEVERRPERRRRPPRPREEAAEQAALTAPSEAITEAEVPAAEAEELLAPVEDEPSDERAENPLLDQLVGREIARRLRGRYREIAARIRDEASDDRRAALHARADALDPDRWATPDAILQGIQHADRLFDELRQEIA
jgi:hypothetical protein